MSENIIKKTILLVEDEIMVAGAQKTALEKFAYRVIPAETGESAVSVFRSTPGIDLVLMDIDLGPGIDGAEAARQILAERSVPVVFLTNHTESDFLKKTESVVSYGYIVKNSKIAVLDTSIKMAFRLFEADKKVHEAFAELNHSQAIAHVCSWRLNLATNLFSSSEEGYRIFGFPLHVKPTFEEVFECVAPGDRNQVRDRMARAVQSGQPYHGEMQIFKKNSGEKRSVFSNVEIEFDSAGHPAALLGTTQDITERKHAEDSLKESEERYKRITAGLNDYLYTVKVSGGKPVETIHNEACSLITGYSISDFAWDPYLWINMVVPEEREMVAGRFAKILEGNDLPTFEHRIIRKDGTIRWISDTCIPKYDESGVLVSYDGVIKDITARKQAEEKIKALLIEKELILKEVHHRIKNNMNTINSLLNLQAGSLKDPAAITALEDAGRRVRSMMMLYDKLYRSEFFSEMSIQQYLPSLVDEILVNFPNSRSVTVEKHIEDFELDVKKLQSIGIIVNELLTNIMKYAFKGKKDGKIIISAYLKNGTVSITIEDNGLGMPESVDFEHSTGFGLMLVGVLTKQLRGELRIGRENGTKISMEFLR